MVGKKGLGKENKKNQKIHDWSRKVGEKIAGFRGNRGGNSGWVRENAKETRKIY